MSHKRSMNVPQAAENAIKGKRAQLRAYIRNQRWGAAGLCGSNRALTLLASLTHV